MTQTSIIINLPIYRRIGVNAMVNIINHYNMMYEIKYLKREEYEYYNRNNR